MNPVYFAVLKVDKYHSIERYLRQFLSIKNLRSGFLGVLVFSINSHLLIKEFHILYFSGGG